MRALLGNRLAPITHAFGFLEISFDAFGDALLSWRREHSRVVERREIHASLEEALRMLEPLTTVPRRELVLSTQGAWTAYFCNLPQGGDPAPPISYLSRTLKCRGLAITCVENTIKGEGKDEKGTYGAVQFELFAPEAREFLNYERTITAANDGGHWLFSVTGTTQPYEQIETYGKKRIQDRFTSEMLEQYCVALGIRVFDESFYGPRGFLVEVKDSLPEGHLSFSLEEARARIGLSGNNAEGQRPG